MYTLKDVNLDNTNLLDKGLSAEDLKGKQIVIVSFEEKSGNMGDFLSITIEDSAKPFNTGAQNIVEKLRAANQQGMLPLKVKVVKKGNSYDIE